MSVSNCCGKTYEEEVNTCAECGSFEIGEKWRGDEGWTICDDCQAVEQGYTEVCVCEKCGDICEPEDESEYHERMRENYLEDKGDAKRKYNE
jgi:hypothetical protein|tara:strand:+ start:697 stop:972 length:276 start_codon:yes stop_codon:yes gene_type:complete